MYATATLPAPTATDSLDALLDSMTPAKRGGKKHAPVVDEPALLPLIDQYDALTSQIDAAESLRQTVKAQILAHGRDLRLAKCRELGSVEATINLCGRRNMVQKCQYSKIDHKNLPLLRETFAADQFLRFFANRIELTVKPEATTDATIKRLIELLGVDSFKGTFDVKRWVEPTEQFHAAYTLDAEIQKVAQPLIDNQVIKPYAPALS